MEREKVSQIDKLIPSESCLIKALSLMEGMYYRKETDWWLFYLHRENNPFFGLFLKFQ